MKQTLILILAVLILSCNTHESKEIELIAFSSEIDCNLKKDSVITIVKCKLYAQIEDDGSCILNIKEYQKGNRFITFKIDKEILDSVYTLICYANSDTTVCKKTDQSYVDGTSIQIVGKNKNGKTIHLGFADDIERSNINCQKLYNLLDSISRKPQNNSDIDTTKILRAKEKLMTDINKKVMALFPPYYNDISIHFIAPVIKKEKK